MTPQKAIIPGSSFTIIDRRRTAMKTLFLIALIAMVDVHAARSQMNHASSIEMRISYFEEYLSNFPPDTKDSIDEARWSRELTSFIDTVQDDRRDGLLRDDAQYYLWLARLNYCGYNLNLPGAWGESEMYYQNVLKRIPKSTAARMGLAALYSNNWDPDDPSTYKNVLRGSELLLDIYRDQKDIHNRTLYHNLIISGMSLHSKARCTDALLKLEKYFTNDPGLPKFQGLVASLNDTSIDMRSDSGFITYDNKYAGFSVRYPDDFLLYDEQSKTNKDGTNVIMIETPLTGTINGDSISNSFSVIATPVSNSSEYELVNNFMNRARNNQDSTKTELGNARSLYFTSRTGRPEKYKGIFTIVHSNRYFYQICYTATESTFGKNFNRFIDFEKSFSLH